MSNLGDDQNDISNKYGASAKIWGALLMVYTLAIDWWFTWQTQKIQKEGIWDHIILIQNTNKEQCCKQNHSYITTVKICYFFSHQRSTRLRGRETPGFGTFTPTTRAIKLPDADVFAGKFTADVDGPCHLDSRWMFACRFLWVTALECVRVCPVIFVH